jgi:hypothetical protein
MSEEAQVSAHRTSEFTLGAGPSGAVQTRASYEIPAQSSGDRQRRGNAVAPALCAGSDLLRRARAAVTDEQPPRIDQEQPAHGGANTALQVCEIRRNRGSRRVSPRLGGPRSV